MKKVKGKLKNFEPTIMVGAMCITLCALLPLRFYHALRLIDPTTGFFSKANFTVPLFFILLGIFGVSFIVVSYLSSRASALRPSDKKNIPLGIVSALTAATFIFDAVRRWLQFSELREGFDQITYRTMSNYLTKTGGTALFLEIVFAILAALWFWVFAAVCFTGKNYVLKVRALSLTPLFWAISCIVFRFVRKISFVNVSDLLLELFFYACIMLFFLAFAQVYSNIDSAEIAWRVYGFGIPSAMLALIISVPRLLLIILGKDELLGEQYGFEPCVLLLGVFIPLLLFGAGIKKGKPSGK